MWMKGAAAVLTGVLIAAGGCAGDLKSTDVHSRVNAVKAITDQTQLEGLINTHPDPAVRHQAARQITDPAVAERLVERWKNGDISFMVIGRLDQAALLRVAQNTRYSPNLRASALREIKDPNVPRQFVNDPAPEVRAAVAERATDPGTKARLIINADRLTWGNSLYTADEPTRIIVAATATDRWLCRMALGGLSPSALAEVEQRTPNLHTRVAASVRAGGKTWKQLLDEAAADGDRLDTLLIALMLRRELAHYEATGAEHRSACRDAVKLAIARGDERRIPLIGDMLQQTEDVEIANIMLNCGNERLHDSARSWVIANRGIVMTKSGVAGTTTWGSAPAP